MHLILQAIKSMFRKLGVDVSNAQATADNAQATADENRPFIVTVRYSKGVGYVPSHTNAEIYEAHQNGKSIILNWEDYETGYTYVYNTVINGHKNVITFLEGMRYVASDSGKYIVYSFAEINNGTFTTGSYRLRLME